MGITTISDRATPTLEVVEFELQLLKKRQYNHMPKVPFLCKVTIDKKQIEEVVTITNKYYAFPYKDLKLKEIVINISLIRTKKINEIVSIIIYKHKKLAILQP